MKILKKRKTQTGVFTIALVLGALILGFNLISSAEAAPLADIDDQFYVERPRASARIEGSSELRFTLYDDDNSQPEYDAGLFRSDCVTRFGTIVSNDYSIKQSGNVYVKSWNSDGPILDQASIPNGNYCLKVCVTLKNAENNYSVCDLRPIILADHVNSNPTITSAVPNTLFLIGQTFGYDVNATDADGDALTYSLTTAPSFLQINSSTGEITSKGALTRTGSFAVVVTVTDGNGGQTSQEFTIQVLEQPTPDPGSVVLISPTEDSVFRDDKENKIEWTMNNLSGISKIILAYSTDAETWNEIAELGASTTAYIWKIENLSSGDYYIRVQIITSDGTTYEDVSDQFSLINSSDENIQDSSSIIEVEPGEDSENKQISEIKAKLVPSQGASINKESLLVLLDDEEVTDSCQIDGDILTCSFDEPLSEGNHKVYMEFEDSAGKKTSKQWFFSVKGEEKESESSTNIDANRTILIILGICGLVLLLLVIPWMLYLMWRRRNEDQTNISADTYSQDNYGQYDPYSLDSGTGAAGSGVDYTQEQPLPAQDVNVNIGDAGEVVDVNKEPARTEDFDAYSIGEGSLSGDDYQEAETPQVQPAPVQPGQAAAQPAAQKGDQFSEDDIPDWLKEETYSDEEKKALNEMQGDDQKNNDNQKGEPADSSAAQPIGPSGQTIDLNTIDEKKEEIQGAEPYGDYGLAQKDND